MTGFDKLDAAMALHKKKNEEAVQAKDRAQEERKQFEQEARLFLTSIVHPVFEMVGNHLHRGGHEFHIEQGDDDLSITLHIYVDSTRAEHYLNRDHMSHPQIALKVDPHSAVLRFYAVRKFRSGGGQSGSEGRAYGLAELNADIVRNVAIDVISDSLTK
ncbi:hypothetical protein LGM38_17360 [Burkholderia vietnamiensis]|uniref:hypothetical protein n=1 Tax=Burkholderia vietnamiensis TaxID=60552 RepID=UPI001CF3D270|nr:hypothetical protein [Burkholderia vietnamiensis]MCA8013818.1 hypothetical protein [Burkholderia vietnamiensis]